MKEPHTNTLRIINGMAPKRKKSPSIDPQGIFSGMVVFLVETGVQSRRLQVFFLSVCVCVIRSSAKEDLM